MTQSSNPIEVYLEAGKKRTFAGAIEWPGWCRSGRDEAAALAALVEYGLRYAAVLDAAGIAFRTPAEVSELQVVERLAGGAGTDFGAPEVSPSADSRPVAPSELQRLEAVLSACWKAFDAAVERAAGRELRKGPRGGGREVDGILEHILGADAGYLTSLGWKYKPDSKAAPGMQLSQVRQAMLSGLAAAARGEIAERGPRGGARWKPRYFVRRVAWHVLDHAWEIEDRMV